MLSREERVVERLPMVHNLRLMNGIIGLPPFSRSAWGNKPIYALIAVFVFHLIKHLLLIEFIIQVVKTFQVVELMVLCSVNLLVVAKVPQLSHFSNVACIIYLV